MALTYTVQKGDTLYSIAQACMSSGGNVTSMVNQIVSVNNIANPNRIVVGQVLIIPDGVSSITTNNVGSTALVNIFALQAATDRTVYATWLWDKANTDHYEVKWYYNTGDPVWFVGNDSTVDVKQSVYNAPSNAIGVRFVVKPVSETYTVNDTDVSYWTASWSTERVYYFVNNPPSKPDTPSVEIKEYTLTATLDNVNLNAAGVEFQVIKYNSGTWVNCYSGKANIVTNHVSFSCAVEAGSEYKVRCRSYRNDLYSDWTEYSSNAKTIPSVPAEITICRANSKTSVYLSWTAVNSATSYDIEYTTKKEYFDITSETSTVNGVTSVVYEKTDLTTGTEYFFRVRATNNAGSSAWSGIKSVIIGTKPSAPTTWSSTTTLVVGEPLNLYWVHNSEDGSSQTLAELKLTVDGTTETYTIENSTDENEKDKTSVWSISEETTLTYTEDTKISWKVRTKGVYEDEDPEKEFSDWSIERTVDVYTRPQLELRTADKDKKLVEILEAFPFTIYASAQPTTQKVLGYYLSISSEEVYETIDYAGNIKTVNAGEEIYSKYFDTSNDLEVEMSANNLILENNIHYKITCRVSMNSGLTAEESLTFSVAWERVDYEPNCEIGLNKDNYSISIRPYCEDADGNLINDILLSVYRRDFDDNLIELASGIDNLTNTFITDPHPPLDYARYRIVAMSKSTGKINYYDVPSYPVGGKEIIIQWDEKWSNFYTGEVPNEDEFEQPVWSGSLLRLPYNVDVSDNNKPDVSLVNYIGRSNPVSYYGTQLGHTSTWNTDIDKKDRETVYALRRLSKWMGDVYVREPFGSGYWANVTVSFSQKHCEVVIPVTLNVTRVEGGI